MSNLLDIAALVLIWWAVGIGRGNKDNRTFKNWIAQLILITIAYIILKHNPCPLNTSPPYSLIAP